MTIEDAIQKGYPVKQWDMGNCFYCEVRIFRIFGGGERFNRYHPQKYTKDHIVPRVKGGKGRTVPCCERCNRLKDSLSLDGFIQKAKYLSPEQVSNIRKIKVPSRLNR